ncbi:hypothetical protein HY967_04940 [Candidatus Jorgensenbacteria bacterium]|nr:hypothetical protein [Candidatus Jorgensenbacteria bacterium]
MYPESLHVYREQLPYLNDIAHAVELADRYQVPVEDILLIGLNLSGIRFGKVENDRGRFSITMPSGKSYYVALTITNAPLSNFTHDGSTVSLGDEKIGKATEIEKDTCTDSYWRNRTHLTLNSNSRSICRGCSFCGTYNLERADKPLKEEEILEQRASELLQEVGSFSDVDALGIVTGCFLNEEATVDHIRLVRKVFSQIGFRGEIQYVGSQIKTEASIAHLIEDGPFALYLTLEVFSRREALMKKQKSSLNLLESRWLLKAAKNMGGESSFLYIAGLDPMSVIRDELPQFADVVTRFPQLQTYQLYTPDQIELRDHEADSLDYYLQLRQLAEQVFPNLRPVTFHNYRGLWYSQYRAKPI